MRFHRPVQVPSAYESGTWGIPGVPCPSARTLAARLDGELDAERAAAVDSHLRSCPVCDSDFRRIESLAGCVKAWDAKAQGVVPPTRLASRILRDVEVEAGVRQRQHHAEGRRAWAIAASVALVLGGSALLGARGASDSLEAPPPSSPRVTGAVYAPLPIGSSLDRALPALRLPSALAAGSFDPTTVAALARAVARADLSVLEDRDARGAFAQLAARKEIEDRLGEPAWWRDGGRALASFAVRDFDRSLRFHDRLDVYERRVQETRTVVKGDTKAYLPFSAAFPLPVAEGAEGADLPYRDAAAFVRGLYLHEVSPAKGAATVLLRFLGGGGGAKPARVAGTVLDLAEAVRKDRVVLVDEARPDSLLVEVQSDVPVFVPAGELIAGGLVDRAVARGAWLPAGTYRERLACRPVARGGAAFAHRVTRPAPVNAIAGPGLRGLLMTGASQDEVQALVDSMLRAAGVNPAPSGASLIRLYAADADAAVEARARAAAVPFTAGDSGFVATDADGRFQGVESVALLEGSAGTALLRRLLAGYLIEAQGRTAELPRGGPTVDTAIFDLARKAPPLLAPAEGSSEGRASAVRSLSGEEPVTGIELEAVLSDAGAVVWATGVLPEYR